MYQYGVITYFVTFQLFLACQLCFFIQLDLKKTVTREKFNFSDDGKLNHRLLHEIVARNNQPSGLRTQTDFWSSFLSTRK